jgi:hypothetical protein
MASLVAQSSQRVSESTSTRGNQKIFESTVKRLQEIGSNRELIDERLQELDKEWDIERAIETNASTLALAGLALGIGVDKRWLAVPAVVATFLFQHAIQGWCPPVPVLRRMGFRTQREIDNERAVLLARRGVMEEIKNAA